MEQVEHKLENQRVLELATEIVIAAMQMLEDAFIDLPTLLTMHMKRREAGTPIDR